MAYEELDGTDVICQFLGKRQRLAHQTGHALSQRVIEALDVIGCSGVLGDGLVLLRWDHPFIDSILVRVKHCLFTIAQRTIRVLATLAAAISDMKRNDLAGDRIHGDPDPLFLGFLLYQAPHLIGFRFQSRQHHRCRPCGELHVEIIGTGRKAFHHKVQEPCEADTHGTADPGQ